MYASRQNIVSVTAKKMHIFLFLRPNLSLKFQSIFFLSSEHVLTIPGDGRTDAVDFEQAIFTDPHTDVADTAFASLYEKNMGSLAGKPFSRSLLPGPVKC